MGVVRQPDRQKDSRPTTLADVLSAKGAVPRVREEHWAGLVRSVAGGDQTALHALYAQLHRIVFTLIVRITSNRETAEELTLDVFHDVWRRAPTYDPAGGPVVGWILNQARCRAIDRLRYEQRRKRGGDHRSGPPATAIAGPGGRPDDALERREQARLLQHALQLLTPPERQAIETAFFSELTYGETAARLKAPVGTVKTRIRSGLGKLRQALAGTRDRT